MDKIEEGQLRRFVHGDVPIPEEWYDKIFVIVSRRVNWIDARGTEHSTCDILIESQLDQGWADHQIAKWSVLVDQDETG